MKYDDPNLWQNQLYLAVTFRGMKIAHIADYRNMLLCRPKCVAMFSATGREAQTCPECLGVLLSKGMRNKAREFMLSRPEPLSKL